MRMQWRSTIVFLLTVVLAMSGTALWAQASTGGISGKVLDAQGQSIPGAEVVVTSKFLQGPRGTVTNLDGEFVIPYLPPGSDYKLIAEASGYGKVVQSNVTVNLGSTTTLTVTLAGSTEVVVTAKPPAIAMKDTKVSTNLTQEELETIPVGRSYQDVLYLAPSVVSSGLGGNPGVSGATANENIYLLNGLNTTDPVTGTFGTNLNYNFIREMEVGHGGYEAEYGASTGGLFNVLPKSGTNEFHGEAFFYYQSDQFNASSRITGLQKFVGGTVTDNPFHSYDYGFDIGGPIVKDRLWFFAGYNPTMFTTNYQGVLANPNLYGTGPDREEPYNYDTISRNWFWSVKLTWRVTDKHNLDFFVTSDPSHMWYQEGTFPSLYGQYNQMSRRYQGGYSAGLKWFATWNNKLFSEVLLGATHGRLDILPWEQGAKGYGTPLVINEDYLYGLAVTSGFGSYTVDDRDSEQFTAKVTYLAGKHEIKAGFQSETGIWDSYSEYTGGYFADCLVYRNRPTDDISDPYYYRIKYLYRQRNPGTHEKSGYKAVFAQDKWSLTDYLNLSYGLRWEQNQIRTQNGNSASFPSVSPRLGFTYDFTHNGKSKLYGSYGQYYQRIPIALSTSMDKGHETVLSMYRSYGWPTPQKIVYGAVPTTVVGGTKNQFDHEYVLGVEYEVLPDLTLGARAVYRYMGRLLEDVGWYDGTNGNINYVLANPGGNMPQWIPDSWRNSSVPAIVDQYPNPTRVYRALEITANKRYSNRWFMNVNYTLSKLTGNSAGGYDQTIGQLNPSASQEYDVPSAYALYNKAGLLPNDRTHNLKIQGSYRFDFGLIIGAAYQAQSGRPITKMAGWPVNPDGYGTEFLLPRGKAGRLPVTWKLDLHAEYAWKLWQTELSIFADIFNVTNEQRTTAVYQTYFLSRDNFGQMQYSDGSSTLNPYYGKETAHQSPRSARLGFKWAF